MTSHCHTIALEKARSERSTRNADPPYFIPARVPPSAKMFFTCIPASDESLHNISVFLKSISNQCTAHQQHNVVVVISTSISKKKQRKKWLRQHKKTSCRVNRDSLWSKTHRTLRQKNFFSNNNSEARVT